MKTPNRLDFTPEQIEALIERLNQEALIKEDYPLLAQLVQALVWMNFSLQEKELSIQRLKKIFGIKTESASNLAQFLAAQKAADNAEQDLVGSDLSKTTLENLAIADKTAAAQTENGNIAKEKKKNHGHRPAKDYTEAKTLHIAHQLLKKGSTCPGCLKGRLFNLSPGTVIRIVGQPSLQVEIYRPERLRCALCGQIFTAELPKEINTGSRSDISAKTIVSLLKYRGGLPFYRQSQLQDILGAPVSASEIWEMTEEVADALHPIYAKMCEAAAGAAILQNDDTKARILSVMQERKEKKGTSTEDKRTGTFTTGILAILKDPEAKIGLFFTGVQHAGENLDDLLDQRPKTAAVPIQQCDGGHNVPEHHETQLSNCNAHCRRKFYELVQTWPKIVLKIIGWYSIIFSNEPSAPKDPLLRLKWHQDLSAPVMKQIKEYCDLLIEQKEIEPNSGMGKAIAYLNNHWTGLTLFLRVPGVPLDNNDTERLLKRAVLNRKNAYFYRNETGAKIGDILMSMIETCVLNSINPWIYLLAVQKHQGDVRKNAVLWLPWLYEKRLKELLLV